jgi:acetoin utilization deacetylase AcuC-like enzyme
MGRVGLVTDARYRQHDTGYGHPECAERCDAVVQALQASGVFGRLTRIEAREATQAELELCHTASYMELVRHEHALGCEQLSTGDTPLSPETLTAATLAAGGAMRAVDAVIEGEVSSAFCLVRPPGHHAEADRGMGFCLYNNVALAARYSQRTHGLTRVAIIDWDVHHGNGTQAIFWNDPSVHFFSTHQAPWYPGTGAADESGGPAAPGATLNRPFPAGAGRHDILGAFEQDLAAALDAFQPEMLFISAGFDSRRDDPLGGFCAHRSGLRRPHAGGPPPR